MEEIKKRPPGRKPGVKPGGALNSTSVKTKRGEINITGMTTSDVFQHIKGKNFSVADTKWLIIRKLEAMRANLANNDYSDVPLPLPDHEARIYIQSSISALTWVLNNLP